MNLVSVLIYQLFIRPISILPFRLLYWISDFLFFIVYYLIGYRKKTAAKNIEQSFPDKSAAEHRLILKTFFRHFCDLVLESFKLFTISEKALRSRFVFKNPEILLPFFERGQSFIIAGGHYNNWEMFASACQLYMQHQAVALYKPLANPWFEQKLKSSRSRFGLQMVPIQQTKAFFEEKTERPSAIIFGMDQSPSNISRCHWMKFLNQDTPVIFGVEKYSKEYNLPVVFGRILKVRRGYYELEMEVLTSDPKSMPHAAIVEKAMQMLEVDINREPPWWLWTHKRWKHKRPANLSATPAQ